MPNASIVYTVVLTRSGWNGTLAVVGPLVLGLVVLIGNWFERD